jgi:MoxR-like ATPase
VAHELGLPYEPWYIKSTSRARDGLYTYDAVRRLHDAQLVRMGEESKSKVDNLDNYIELGPLGRAFEKSQRTVVLIDEIDKADIDFPNDLLRELDEQKFTIEETGKEVKANFPPIVFVTSNDEKDLPDAFLRRCLFYYIEFPYSQLTEIVKAHFPESPPDVVEAAVNRFTELRRKMEKGKSGKKVSTSELLDWFAVLHQFPKDEVLKQLEEELPFPEVLLKKWEDHLRYLKYEA